MTPAQLAPAQRAEVVWQEHDKKHKGWNVHLYVGAEVIKHHLAQADRALADTELISQAVKAAQEEGYELKPEAVTVSR